LLTASFSAARTMEYVSWIVRGESVFASRGATSGRGLAAFFRGLAGFFAARGVCGNCFRSRITSKKSCQSIAVIFASLRSPTHGMTCRFKVWR
jgi:hypothetical protein